MNYLTVGQLINWLNVAQEKEMVSSNSLVILSSDEEGNSYSRLLVDFEKKRSSFSIETIRNGEKVIIFYPLEQLKQLDDIDLKTT